jgi:hypothetical protein
MPDTKSGRERKQRNAERRQRERELAEWLERNDEVETPPELPEELDVGSDEEDEE